MFSAETKVLIIGAGPTGLNLANLLTQYGIPHILVDHKIEPIHTSNALVVQPRSLEMWESMGIANDALVRGQKILGLSLSTNKPIAKIDFTKLDLATQYPFILGLSQADTEKLLTEHLYQQDGKIERGFFLENFEDNEKNITVQLRDNNNNFHSTTCEWLIATDGAHSTVRKKLNLDFKGSAIAEKFIMMDAEISADFDTAFFHAIFSNKGPLVFASMPGFTRIICSVTDDPAVKDPSNPTLADFEYIIKNRSSDNIKINKVLWISHFVTHHRIIDNYCHGKIIFAGDSAHIHSPIGGQGMNTGMQDTYNLAWKLALVIKGKSNKSLLDTYNFERRQVAESVLANTTNMTKVVTLKNSLLMTIRNNLVPFILQFRKVQKIMAERISELDITYKVNSAILNNGKRAPNAIIQQLNGGEIQLRSLLKGLKFQLLIFSGNTLNNNVNIIQLNEWISKNSKDLIEPIIISAQEINNLAREYFLDKTGTAHTNYGLESGGICLIRPDQHIALSSTLINHDMLSQYIAMNFS